MKKEITLLMLAFFLTVTTAWAGISLDRNQIETQQAEASIEPTKEQSSETASEPSVAEMLGVDIVLVSGSETGDGCLATCFDEFQDCVSQCVPPDFDGHPTWTACKLSCRQDLEDCKSCC